MKIIFQTFCFCFSQCHAETLNRGKKVLSPIPAFIMQKVELAQYSLRDLWRFDDWMPKSADLWRRRESKVENNKSGRFFRPCRTAKWMDGKPGRLPVILIQSMAKKPHRKQQHLFFSGKKLFVMVKNSTTNRSSPDDNEVVRSWLMTSLWKSDYGKRIPIFWKNRPYQFWLSISGTTGKYHKKRTSSVTGAYRLSEWNISRNQIVRREESSLITITILCYLDSVVYWVTEDQSANSNVFVPENWDIARRTFLDESTDWIRQRYLATS